MGTALPSTIARYKILKRLGEGGMGSLYLARDPAIDRLIAIKLLREDVESEELRERFMREAKAVGKLKHQNIVMVFDVGQDAGRPYIAMEYVEGYTLGLVVGEKRQIDLDTKLKWLEEMCSGLAHAHRQNIIHRDVKPANLMVDQDGTLKILDFGIARLGSAAAIGMTQTGTLMGTLAYMSPEQMTGRPVDHRSDIFAVGAVCYEIISYQRAFPGDVQDGVLHRLIHEPPTPLEQIVPGVDSRLVGIINRALEKDRDVRYQDLEAMGKDIARLRVQLELEGAVPPQEPERAAMDQTIMTPMPSPVQPAPPPLTAPPPTGRTADPRQRRKQQIDRLMDTASRAMDSGEIDRALEAVDQILFLEPGHAEALTLSQRAQVILAERGRQAEDVHRDSPPRRRPERRLASPASSAVIRLRDDFSLEHMPLAPHDEQRLLGRQHQLDEIVTRIARAKGGAFLIAGYRGVGKTSFVNQVIGRLETNSNTPLSPSITIVVHENVGEPVKPSVLLQRMIRDLAQQLADTGVLERLDSDLRGRLAALVDMTQFSVKHTSKDSYEVSYKLGGKEAGIGGKIGAAGAIEKTAHPFDASLAETELIRIIRALRKGYVPPTGFLSRTFNRGKPPKRHSVRTVFVFDELDKLDAVPNSQSVVDRIVVSMKNLAAEPDVTLILVAGRDLLDRMEKEKGSGDSKYAGVFGYTVYLSCLWDELDRMVSSAVADGSDTLMPDFIDYLRFLGRGTPRLFIQALTNHVRMSETPPVVRLSPEEVRRVRFCAALERVLDKQRATHDDMTDDRERIALRHLVDWILGRGSQQFSVSDAVAAARALNRTLVGDDASASRLVQQSLALLRRYDYLEEVGRSLANRQLDDLPTRGEKRYVLTSRRVAELGAYETIAAVSEATAGAAAGPQADGYEILERLGEGGMAYVHRGRDAGGAEVAVKFLKEQFHAVYIARRRFEREASVLASLRHPGIVGLRASMVASDSPYIVMDFVQGWALNDLLRAHGPVPLATAARLIAELCSALHHVHEQGFVRNDVKPHNVIIRPDGTPCVIDFGISKLHSEVGVTQANQFVGTPSYCAPEGWSNRFDRRSDVYALGVMLYQLIVGALPFDRPSREALAAAHLHDAPPLPSSTVDVPPALDDLVLKCLAKRPDDRFDTMNQLRAALQPFVAKDAAVLRRFADAASEALNAVASQTVFASPETVVRHVRATEAGGGKRFVPSGLDRGLALRVTIAESAERKVFPFEDGVLKVGRAESCEVRLAGVNVSRYHAVIEFKNREAFVEDLNSANGVYVNGESVRGRCGLKLGDRIGIGSAVLEIVPAQAA